MHRPIRLGVDELMHERILRGPDLIGRSFGDNATAIQEVNVVNDKQRLVNIMGDHDRGGTQRIVQLADQLADHAQRDRVEPGERFVVHDQHGIEGQRSRQRHPTRHAAGQFTWHQSVRTTQTNSFQLHQHQITNHFFRQIGVFPHGESHIVEYRHVGKQSAELEQHAHASAQPVQLGLGHAAYLVFFQANTPAGRPQLAANAAQKRRFTAT